MIAQLRPILRYVQRTNTDRMRMAAELLAGGEDVTSSIREALASL
jgi:hypothetical protein